MIKFSKPKTDAQLQFWKRNGLAILKLSPIAVICIAVEVLFSGSNLALSISDKLSHLPQGSLIGGVTGYGLIFAFCAALGPLCIVLYGNWYKNTNTDTTNDTDTTINVVYALLIVVIAGGLMVIGVNGAANIGETHFAYKANVKSDEGVKSSRAAREAAIMAQAEKDIQVAQANTASALSAAKAKHIAQAQAWQAKAKGSPANIAWAKKQAGIHLAQAESAGTGILAKNTAYIQHIQDIRDEKLKKVQAEYETETESITAHNGKEQKKAADSVALIAGGFQYLSILNVLVLLFIYWLNGRILAKSGMFLETPPSETIHEGSLWERAKMAFSEFFGNHANNLFFALYEKAPVRKEFVPNTANTVLNTVNTADTASIKQSHSPTPTADDWAKLQAENAALRIAAENKPQRTVIKGFSNNPDAQTDANPQMKAVVFEKEPPPTPHLHIHDTPEIQHIHAEIAVYTPNTVGEEPKYSTQDVAETLEVEETDIVLAKSEYTPEITDLLLRYKEGNKEYHENNVKNKEGVYTENRKLKMEEGLKIKAEAANDLYERGYVVKKQGQPFVLVKI